MLIPSICLIMTLSLNLSLIPFLCQWQILMQTMSLPWVCDLLHLPYLLLVNPQGDSQGDGQGDKQGDNLGGKQGGSQGGKVKPMHQHNPTCLLHFTVPVFHTMMHGLNIGCQHMGILFAPSVMLNTG